jgi:hypothetical protein
MQGPIFFRAANMNLLIPELGEEEPTTRVDEATRVSSSLVVAAHRHVDRTSARARERNIRRYRGRGMVVVYGAAIGSRRSEYGAEWVRDVGEL